MRKMNEVDKAEVEKSLDLWLSGVGAEVDYWDSALEQWATYGTQEDYIKRVVKVKELTLNNSNFFHGLEEFVAAYPKEEIKILDVGAGPCSILGLKGVEGKKITIEGCDPLADVYTELREKNKLPSPIDINFFEGELLSLLFPANHFDIVCSCNALDHSFSPLECILNMFNITKVGGAVFLSHTRNEAVNERYRGLHQWNFDKAENDDDLMLWNKKGKLYLKEFIGDCASIKNTIFDSAEPLTEISTMIEKKKDFPNDLKDRSLAQLSIKYKAVMRKNNLTDDSEGLALPQLLDKYQAMMHEEAKQGYVEHMQWRAARRRHRRRRNKVIIFAAVLLVLGGFWGLYNLL